MSRSNAIAELERQRAQQLAIMAEQMTRARLASHAVDRAQVAIIELDQEIDRRRAAERTGNADP